MISKCFALYDMKTGAFGVPFFMRHTGEALRAAADLAADPNTVPGRHPADFSLMLIGEFDDATGLLVPQQPASLGTLVSMLPAPATPAPLFDEQRPARLNGAKGPDLLIQPKDA